MSKASRRRAVGTDLGKLMHTVQAMGGQNLWDVFADFVEMAAIAISNSVDLRSRAVREARYLDIIRRYKPDQQKIFPQMLAAVVDRLEAGPDDVLGKLFGELELGNDARGQFFTPFTVCQLMAGILSGDQLQADIERQGYVAVNEPACGAGAMVIAFAEALQKQGINYQQHMHATCQDVDSRAVHMCYLQLSLLHVPAQIVLGNTLALECRDIWFTPAHILGGWSLRLAKQSAAEIRLDETHAESFGPPEPPAASNDNTPETDLYQMPLF